MFKDDTFGFGTLIAYVVPGFTALVALANCSPPIKNLLANAASKEAGIGPVTLVLLAALPCGMIVSVIRGSTIDHTFRCNLRRFSSKLYEHYRALPKVEPLLAEATRSTPLEVVKEVRARFHSPFQFYGNMTVALAFLGCAMAVEAWPLARETILLGLGGFLCLCALLYSAARGSYARTIDALTTPSKDIVRQKPMPPLLSKEPNSERDEAAQPCATADGKDAAAER